MISMSYGNYNSRTSAQSRYQTAGRSQKSSGNDSFGTKVSNQEHYIRAPRDGSWATCPEVDKIPSKYELKDGKAITWCWRAPGIEYRFFHAAESTDENPVLVARGVDEHGKLFEEKIDVKQINPYNTTHLEIDALSCFKPGHYKTIMTPYGSDGLGIQERFDFITDYQKDIRACNRLRLTKEAAWLQEEVDFLLSFTMGGTGLEKTGSAYTVDTNSLADFTKENERNLELYSSAARERLIYGMAQKCSEELSDMLWKK